MHARSQVAGDRNEPRFYLPDFCAARSVELSRSLNPQLQDFATWAAAHAAEIPIT